jgi:hypothetical protein
VHGITSPIIGALNDTTSGLGLPLPDLPLLGILQNADHNQTASAATVSDDGDNDIQTESDDDTQTHGYDAPACQVAPYNMSVVSMMDTVPAPFDETKANIFRYRQQQSVNLGSWYVACHSLLDGR